jgi:hypothetical protein
MKKSRLEGFENELEMEEQIHAHLQQWKRFVEDLVDV